MFESEQNRKQKSIKTLFHKIIEKLPLNIFFHRRRRRRSFDIVVYINMASEREITKLIYWQGKSGISIELERERLFQAKSSAGV